VTLAEDLVTAAAQAIRRRNARPWRHSDAVQHASLQGQDATVAVLRGLATYRGDGPPVQWDFYNRPDLVRLADEIEGGRRG
jgi:hypothetical protein